MKLTATNSLIVALGLWGAWASSSALAQTTATDPYQALIKREFGTVPNELAAIEKEIASTKPDQYPAIEARLIAVLEAPDATLPGKQFACQMLRTVGSAQCVPAVSRLLTDERLSHIARLVLQGMREAAAGEALRKALAQTQGNMRIGLLNTLGDRGELSSLEALVGLAANSDDATARAALNALGKIAGVQTADALERIKVPASLNEAWAAAYLRCAASLPAGEAARAEKMYRSLCDGEYPLPVRAGAFTALTQVQKEQAVPLIVKTLSAKEALLRRAALGAISSVPGHAATRAFGRELASQTPETKLVLLGALASRGDGEGLTEMVNKLATDENQDIREAAIQALARLGDASSVPALAAALKQKETAPGISQTLVDLQGAGVIEALVKQAEAGDPAVRQGVLNVLAQRRQSQALPVVRKALGEDDAQIRRVALKALAALGTQEDLNTLAAGVLAKKDEAERDQMAQAMADIGGRLSDKTARCAPVLLAFGQADASTKLSLLAVLSTLGGDQALQAVRASLAGSGELRKAAVRALAEWPDPAPMADLLSVAKSDPDKASQTLALRGYIRMVSPAGGRSEQKLQAYREALTLAAQPNEKRLVLAGLAEVTHLEALKTVEPFLEDAGLKREAFISYEKIAEGLASRQPTAAKEALQRVVDKATDAGLRSKARRALDKIK